MVNVVIYIKKEFDAEALVVQLLEEKLIATASIDANNVFYKIENGILVKEIYSVITAKTKSLLIQTIIKSVEEKIKSAVLINAIPIVGWNNYFDELIKVNTIKI